MNTNGTIKVCGSITKNESLVKLKENILPHTVVAEANLPYSNYYGRIPRKAKPNSLFLFTDRYYSLEEALRFNQNIDFCAKNEVDAASAIMQFKGQCHPSIRLKNFPDYPHLGMLQQCYIDQGVKYAKKVNLETETMVTVNKCFKLKEKAKDIYLDQDEKNEGYVVIPQYIDYSQFIVLMNAVRNNSDCPIFDAAMGGLIIDGKAINIIRIYSEHLDISLLECVKKDVLKQFKQIDSR